jgi:hypothetical protein
MKRARFEEDPSGLSSIERLGRFMKALVAVPKTELDAKLAAGAHRKRKQRARKS